MTYTQNKRYGNLNINGNLNILDITQFDKYENRITSNISNQFTYSTIIFEVNKLINQFYIYKEIGENIELLLDYNTITNNITNLIYNNKYNNLNGRFINKDYQNNRVRLEYTGPVTRLILTEQLLL
jgi:hypothetical protein